MQIQIPDEVAVAVRDRAAASGFENVEEFVITLLTRSYGESDVEIDHDGDEQGLNRRTRMESPEEWIARFDAWIATQRSRNPNFDDSRESIYEGR